MSVSSQLTRITDDRNTIRNKLVNFGLATSTDNLDDLAEIIDSIINRGSPSAQVTEGDSYTIQPGFYTGGTVQGVSGGGNYNLQSKTITPTKSQQSIAPDSGYYGLSSVLVNAIPAIYQDVSGVTASASDVLANKTIVTADGSLIPGTMSNNGAISKTLDATTNNQSYSVPVGYHNGSGLVQIVLETKTATPSESTQSITPSTGKVLSQITINPIPSDYIDVSGATITSGDIIEGGIGYTYIDDTAVEVTGTMPNIGTVTRVLDATSGNQSYTIAAGKHSGSGSVSIVLETKSVTPTTSVQTVTPTNGKVLSSVSVGAIPSEYKDVSGVTATAGAVLVDNYFVTSSGVLTEGTMANNGSITGTIDGLSVTSYTISAGYTSGGTVNLTDDIEEALAAI